MSHDLKLIANNFPENKKLFLKEKQKLEELLSDFDIQVEHIGSTSIPGTIGKGILDILLICSSPTDQEMIKDVLNQSGYTQGELNKIPDGRFFFCNTMGKTEAGDLHLHLVIKDSNNLESIAFRDHLLKNPEEVENYNQEKQRLAQATNNDRHDYAVNKESFIKKIMRKIV
jgi:GrpB-like predicted nucleotidyltransferase (UPF0157 family)